MASLADGLRINRRGALGCCACSTRASRQTGLASVWHVAEGGGHFFRSTQLQQQQTAALSASADRRRRH